MSVSQRKLIRKKVQELLSADGGIPGVLDVVLNRQARIGREETPLLMVYTRSESAEEGITAPREMKRTLKLVVELAIYDKIADSVDDLMDDVAEEVENRLCANETLDDLASDLVLSDTEVDFITESENELGAIRVTFDVTYYKEASRDPDDLPDFETYTAEYKPGNATEVTEPIVDETEFDDDEE